MFRNIDGYDHYVSDEEKQEIIEKVGVAMLLLGIIVFGVVFGLLCHWLGTMFGYAALG